MTYYLGIDIGSTKSHALIADQDGRALGFAKGGAGNPENVGYDGLASVLRSITQEALAQAELSINEIAGAGFGISGYDWPSQKAQTLKSIEVLGLNAPVGLVNDALIALLAGASQGWGVAVIAGTSCNAWGWDQSRQKIGRMTGMGAPMGEYAGASELVAEAIKAVALSWTHRAPPTQLSKKFIELTQAKDIPDLLEGLGCKRYSLKGSAAPIVFQIAQNGDAVARDLVLWAGRELGSMANGVIRQLGFENQAFEIVLAGSFFNGSPLLAGTMREVIEPVAPDARLVRLDAPPVVGGVMLGFEQAGVNPLPLRQTLISSLKKMMLERQ
jgi:N-acetylglucosamine kinase-like BadF-type ATPase